MIFIAIAGGAILLVICYLSLKGGVKASLEADTARVEREIARKKVTLESKEHPTFLPSLEDMESEEMNEVRGLPSSVLQDEEDKG